VSASPLADLAVVFLAVVFFAVRFAVFFVVGPPSLSLTALPVVGAVPVSPLAAR
jgi:hypothetical protein